MDELIDEFPDVGALLVLEPHELGIVILKIIKKRLGGKRDSISRHNFVLEAGNSGDPSRGTKGFPQEHRSEIQLAVSEAFSWLENSGLLVPEPGGSASSWLVLSRRAMKINHESEFERLNLSAILPRNLLHSILRDGVWTAFVRGELDVAVFQAMKQVEVEVREAAGFKETDHGVPMVRSAFHKDTGPLRDANQNEAEREALMHLFAGAIGSYKNPHSHRNVPLDEPAEAAEIILLANHLLRIIDSRSPQK